MCYKYIMLHSYLNSDSRKINMSIQQSAQRNSGSRCKLSVLKKNLDLQCTTSIVFLSGDIVNDHIRREKNNPNEHG